MEIVYIGVLIFFLIFLGFILWLLMEAREEVKYLKIKLRILENKIDQEPEQQINIDYQNLNQEL